MCLLVKSQGEHITGLDPKMFGTHTKRQRLTDEIIPSLIVTHQAIAAALILPVWQVKAAQIGQPLELIERDHGKDGVLIQAAAIDRSSWQVATLTRYKDKPPTLGAWMEPDPDSPPAIAGIQMQQALLKVRDG